jgi:hypothetical protein
MPSADTVAEWLRRWIANPLLFERACSNHACVVIQFCPTGRCQDELLSTSTINNNFILYQEISITALTNLFTLCKSNNKNF